MLIDIPVFISFNAEGPSWAHVHSRNTVFGRTFTMRFDPEDTDTPPQWALTYPPKPDTKFWPDHGQFLFEVWPSDMTEKRLIEIANQDPESYFVDKEAAQRAVGEDA